MGIKTSHDLDAAISRAIKGDLDILWDIAVYKLYNYYMSIHVEHGSKTDLENEQLFNELQLNHPEIHRRIEELIDQKIELEGLI